MLFLLTVAASVFPFFCAPQQCHSHPLSRFDPVLAEEPMLEYQAHSYEAQQVGDVNQMTVQLKKESTLRTITGFDQVLPSPG